MSIYDVEQFSIGNNNATLLSTYTVNNTSGILTLDGQPVDREVDVLGQAILVSNGQTVQSSDDAEVQAITPKTPTTWQQTVDAYQALRSVVQQFGDQANAVLNAFMDQPQTFVNTLIEGLKGALKQFVADLPTTLKDSLVTWLLGQNGASLVQFFQNANWSDPNTITSFFLQYSGLTWDHVYSVVQQQLAGNLAAIESVVNWFGGNSPIDPTKPDSMYQFLSSKIDGINVNQLADQVKQALLTKAKSVVPGAVAQSGGQVRPWGQFRHHGREWPAVAREQRSTTQRAGSDVPE